MAIACGMVCWTLHVASAARRVVCSALAHRIAPRLGVLLGRPMVRRSVAQCIAPIALAWLLWLHSTATAWTIRAHAVYYGFRLALPVLSAASKARRSACPRHRCARPSALRPRSRSCPSAHCIASHRIASPASQSLSSAAQLVAPFVALRSAACCTMCCTLHAVAFVQRHVACRLSSRHTRHSLPLVNPVVRSAPCGELRAHASALSDGFPFHHWAASCRRQMTLGRDARPPVLQRNSPL